MYIVSNTLNNSSLQNNNNKNIFIIKMLIFALIYFYRIDSHEYYVDIIGNHGENLIAILHNVDLHILNPSRNLIDKLYVTCFCKRIVSFYNCNKSVEFVKHCYIL